MFYKLYNIIFLHNAALTLYIVFYSEQNPWREKLFSSSQETFIVKLYEALERFHQFKTLWINSNKMKALHFFNLEKQEVVRIHLRWFLSFRIRYFFHRIPPVTTDIYNIIVILGKIFDHLWPYFRTILKLRNISSKKRISYLRLQT